jgi:acetyl-CoA/propionyl-CoA carboxylase biotin carboxyl carrier protein
VDDPAFTENFSVYTSYIESEFVNEIPAFDFQEADNETKAANELLVAEVNGKRFEIKIHTPAPVVKRHRAKQSSVGGATGTGLASPMQGTVVKIAVQEGAQVEAGDLIIVLEAMKMEQPLNAHKSGIVTNLKVAIGETVASATVLCDIIDA